MAEPFVCWSHDAVHDILTYNLIFANDMETDAVPPASFFDLTCDGAPFAIAEIAWATNHRLQVWGTKVGPPMPPPKPTIDFPIFNRGLRYEFGTVYNAFGPLDLDECVVP